MNSNYNYTYYLTGFRLKLLDSTTRASMTGGLVQEYEHQVLPSIKPSMTFILTFISMLVSYFHHIKVFSS